MTETNTTEAPVDEAPVAEELTHEEIRSQVDQLRQEIEEEKARIARQEADANAAYQKDSTLAERDRLRADLASMRGVSVEEVPLPDPVEAPTPGFSTLEEIEALNAAQAAKEADAASGIVVAEGVPDQVPAEAVVVSTEVPPEAAVEAPESTRRPRG